MKNNNEQIVSREITTPFDFIQQGNPEVLDLNDSKTITKTELNAEPIVEDPNLEAIEDDIPQGGDPNDPAPYDDGASAVDDEDEIKDPPNDEGDDGEGEPEADEYDVDIKANLAKYAAEALKAQGGLPDDFEISDDITEADLDAAYVNYKEETLRNQISQEEKQRLAEEEGLTPEMIEEVKMKYYGVQDPEIQELQYLNYLSSYAFDEKSETFAEDAKSFLTSYYALKKINESRIAKLVETDLEDEGILTIISEAQKDLHNDYIDLDQNVKEKVRAKQEALVQKRKENKDRIDQLLKSETIGGVKYTSEEMKIVKKALFDKTEIVVGPDGKKYRATLYYKKRMEAAQDLEKDLQNKINFILGGDSKTLKNREREKTTKKILNKLNNYVDVNVKKSSKKPQTPTNNKKKEGIEMVEIN